MKTYTEILSKTLLASAIIVIVATALTTGTAEAHDYIPGKSQTRAILLKGGDLYTVSSGIQRQTDLIFDNGIITQIGKNLTAPADAEVIDVSGKRVYPGLIAPETGLGLTEIGAVRATRDGSETGSITPEVRTHIAYNPDSELLPTIRSNGITTALVVPGGSLIRGLSSLLNLDGWTKEDAAEKLDLGLSVSWPRQSIINAWWMSQAPEEQIKNNNKSRKKLVEVFKKAHRYYTAKQSGEKQPEDLRWEAMAPVFSGDMPVMISASDYRQIDQALELAKEFDLKIIIVGGGESWKLAERLKRANVPVILRRVQSMPMRQDEGYDAAFRLPKLLADAGVKFCFSNSAGRPSTWDSRNLPFQAGQAIGAGLSPETALRSLTLTTAEILGVADRIGSLEVGKKATIVVSEGDLLDALTNKVVYEFIGGRKVDLNNRHKALYHKYRQKTL
jgi:imidazolonepropionase-like amidohydrolase